MVQQANGARSDNEFCNVILTLASNAEWKAIQLTTSFQEVRMEATKTGIFKRCAFHAILRKGGGFLITLRHP
jgi:hypothetical protein